MESSFISLNELGTLIKRVISLNFQNKIWVKAEIAGCKIVRGVAYLDLIEKEEGPTDKIIAQQSAVIWQTTLLKLNQKLTEPIHGLLETGREVLISVQVDYHTRYGLKLNIDDIDPAYTLGKLFLQRQELEKLIYSERLHQPNKGLPIPLVIQKIAILSNDQAAGYQDFIHQLINNGMGYTFDITLFPISLQGVLVEETVLAQLNQIEISGESFDVILIVRGGGSKLDLAGFDSIKICRALAALPIKVITGIGHEIDETLVDIVAGISLKTPTAVAEYILQHNQTFEMTAQQLVIDIHHLANVKIQEANRNLMRLQFELSSHPGRLIARQFMLLENIQKHLPSFINNRLKKENVKLSNLERLIHLLSIANTLKRGFTITQVLPGHQPIFENMNPQTEIETLWEKGSFRSIIVDNKP
jgi:exodeoxyribonuclease VII large subunit